MRSIRLVCVLAALLPVQPIFANDMSDESKACTTIAKACMKAGFKHLDSGNKRFWFDCMKPIVLGQDVKGVKIDADTVKTCRTDKIAEMQKEIDEMQKISS